MVLAVVRELREQRAPAGPEELAEFETVWWLGSCSPEPQRGLADATTLATASGDDTVRLWNLDVDQVTEHVCRIIGTPSQDQWAQLILDLPYQPTCQ